MTERRFVWGMMALGCVVIALCAYAAWLYGYVVIDCYRSRSPFSAFIATCLEAWMIKMCSDTITSMRKLWRIRNDP